MTASSCSSSEVKNAVIRPTATDASIIEVITIGSIARGNVKRLKSVNAGKTMSVVSGWLWVNTKTVNVEQETKNGVVDHVKLATDLGRHCQHRRTPVAVSINLERFGVVIEQPLSKKCGHGEIYILCCSNLPQCFQLLVISNIVELLHESTTPSIQLDALHVVHDFCYQTRSRVLSRQSV